MNTLENIFGQFASGKNKILHKGEILFHQGDAIENVYVVQRGRIKLIRNTEDGNPVILQLAMAGDVIAEASLFSDVYHCSAVVDNPSAELSCFNRQGLLAAFKASPATAMKMMELFAHRIRKLRAILEIRNIRSARQRIYSYFQLESDTNKQVQVQLSYKDLAYRLGLAHETFYRELKCLEDEGKIKRKDHSIRLS